MILTTKNDRLYDSRNFDSQANVYAVYIDKRNIEYNKQFYQDEYDKLHIKYTRELFLIKLFFSDVVNVKNYQNGYKIVYGHFYNKEDLFLYKNTHNGNIIGYKVKQCLRDQLYFNKNNSLLCSRSYKTLENQVKYINLDETEQYTSNLKPKELHCTYYDETLNITEIGDMYSTIQYESNNNCLELIPIITKTIINLN